AEAFLADVECTTHYDDSLAITTTTTFKVNHKDAYDSDVDKAPHAAATFMANLTGISTGEGTSNDTDFHSEHHWLIEEIVVVEVYNEVVEGHIMKVSAVVRRHVNLSLLSEPYKQVDQCSLKIGSFC
nr:hypothetical protein [Tanacetum cinerariifolium]